MLIVSSLAKLGVFYTLTHFGMEKHENEKLTWLYMTWHLSPEADCKRGSKRGREGEKEGSLLLLLLLLLFKNLVELLLWVEKCNCWMLAFSLTGENVARLLAQFYSRKKQNKFGNEKSNNLKLSTHCLNHCTNTCHTY